jgi:hypothetical protein
VTRDELIAELAKQRKAARYWHEAARREQKNTARLSDVLRRIRDSITKAIGE